MIHILTNHNKAQMKLMESEVEIYIKTADKHINLVTYAVATV